MSIVTDLAVFIADFGVSASSGGRTAIVLFDQPGVQVFEGMQVSNEYEITYVKSDFSALKNGDAITVDGGAYFIRGEPQPMDDGYFAKAYLRK